MPRRTLYCVARRAHIQATPARSDVLIRSNEIEGPRRRVVALREESLYVVEGVNPRRSPPRRVSHGADDQRLDPLRQIGERHDPRAQVWFGGLCAGEIHACEAAAELVQEPGAATAICERCFLRWCSREYAAREWLLVWRAEWRRGVSVGGRQASTVDQPARERIVLGEFQCGVTERAAHATLRCDEISAARGVEDVFVRRRHPLEIISVKQAGRRFACQNQRQLPDQVVDVLNPPVGAARAERRNLMGGIAREQHTAVPEFLHAPA